MATPLKHHFGPEVARRLAAALERAWPDFPSDAFIRDALDGYDTLELMDRGRHLARVLRGHLPDGYPEALGILLQSIGPRPARQEGDGGMASFFYLPHVSFVAQFGLDHFDESMDALHALTKRFTGEFSVRPFIERYPDAALDRLRTWTSDPDVHVRRLVSEGTRPRLPWAARLRMFQADPSPVLDLLERLKDDPEEYVRRSVANNLNDIGKDHPGRLVAVAGRWMIEASSERRALVRHALRSLAKAGHEGALGVLGYGHSADVAIEDVVIDPAVVSRGSRVGVAVTIRNRARHDQHVLVDLRVHFVKGGGRSSPKVFRMKAVELAPAASARLSKTISLADLTTRRHYPGRHVMELLVNGEAVALGSFELT